MLTPEGCRLRRERLLREINAPEALILINDPLHVFYLTNFWIAPSTLNAGGPCWLIIEPGGAATLLIDNFSKSQGESAHVDRLETFDWYTTAKAGGNRHSQLNANLVQHLAKKRIAAEKLAYCFERMPHEVMQPLAAEREGRPAINVTPILEQMRRAKDPDELIVIDRLMRIGEAIHAASWDFVRPGMNEHDLYRRVHDVALEAAGEPITMRCGIKASPVAQQSSAAPTLTDGMLVILDMFPVLNGYRCDITNTICVGGKPTRRQQFLFDLCKEAMAAGEKMLRPGVRANDVYAAVNSVFTEAGEAHLFPHHAGHAIGLAHPEPPYFIPGADEVIVENAVFTLEPGLYDPQHGGMRIEHNYLITKDGPITLSKHRIGLTKE